MMLARLPIFIEKRLDKLWFIVTTSKTVLSTSLAQAVSSMHDFT